MQDVISQLNRHLKQMAGCLAEGNINRYKALNLKYSALMDGTFEHGSSPWKEYDGLRNRIAGGLGFPESPEFRKKVLSEVEKFLEGFPEATEPETPRGEAYAQP